MDNHRDAAHSAGKTASPEPDQGQAAESALHDCPPLIGSVGQLGAALAKAQASIQPATKTGLNPHYGNRYADLASVWAACRDSLTRNGLSVVQMPDYDPRAHCVSVTTILLHSSGEYIVSTARTPIAKTDAQGVGSAITYLRRYGLAAFVGVAPDDDDGEAAIRAGSSTENAGRKPESASPAVWPYGKRRGALLRELAADDLEKGRDWCVEKDQKKHAMLIRQIDEELARRGAEVLELAS